MADLIKQRLFTNWSGMRWFTLIFGLILLYNWVFHSAPISGLLSAYFLYQAVTNTGCLSGNCSVPAAAPSEGKDNIIK